MRQETIVKTYVTFDELAKEQQEKVVEQFSYDGSLYEHCMEERIATLKAFAEYIGGKLDYSLSCVPCRGEFIKIDHELTEKGLKLVLRDFATLKDDCPLTGVCYDEDLRYHVKSCDYSSEGLRRALSKYIQDIHKEFEAMCTVEYIGELCEANEYEFDAETLELI